MELFPPKPYNTVNDILEDKNLRVHQSRFGKQSKLANLIAIVVGIVEPRSSRGTDFVASYVLRDGSVDRHLNVRIFGRMEDMPSISSRGDVVMLFEAPVRS
jgi:hypothetical protein